jgi:hypothetical protein
MATLAKKIEVEAHTRAMLEQEGLPAPDRVEYGVGCIRLFWSQSKTCLVVDIDDPSEAEDDGGLDGTDTDLAA